MGESSFSGAPDPSSGTPGKGDRPLRKAVAQNQGSGTLAPEPPFPACTADPGPAGGSKDGLLLFPEFGLAEHPQV